MNRAHLFLCTMLALAGPAGAATVSMAFGDNLPPFILVREDAGIEVEVVREALAYRGHVLQARYLPMGRIPVTFKAGDIDAIMMDVGEDMTRYGGHYGAAPVIYDNVFYTLASRKLQIRTPRDLQGHSVNAFVGAAARYPAWLQALVHNRDYVENNRQEAQPQLLALGRYEVVLSDRSIFQYYTRLLRQRQPGFVMPALDEHSFTRADPNDYRPVFRDAAIRDDFNAGLAQLHKSGRYRAIYDKYLKD
ncbi:MULTISPECIES: ABC transporter substrate-binding protein [unclassified Duganella]|uniref:substrate-binding periplasmic protein n=1 Tax=unclassified Duganella TaxID=2636909 RepID=UPI001E4165F9|nr:MULTISPECIES: ABC transporter substrate-binding protein [unclassified Duganella]